MPRAFITGITGKDGRHLAEFLHGKGYEVYGMITGQNNPKATTLREEMPFIEFVPGDLADHIGHRHGPAVVLERLGVPVRCRGARVAVHTRVRAGVSSRDAVAGRDRQTHRQRDASCAHPP